MENIIKAIKADETSVQLLYRNALDSECKHMASQHYVYTRVLRLPLRLNFFSQMWQVNQVPSLCDFYRCLELDKPSKTLWTVSTWVRLCTSVNMNMTLQFIFCLKTASHSKNSNMVFCCCAHDVYVTVSGRSVVIMEALQSRNRKSEGERT